MRQSILFTKTRKETPKEEVSKNAELLIRAGFIHKEIAGVYSYLVLGLRVLKKIENIIREEMEAIGAQEVSLTVLQDKSLWVASGRWSDDVVDNWFKSKLVSGQDVGLGFTHEEPLAKILSEHIISYKDLPKYVFQIQTKFRNELRAKSGLMRGREFLMKDLYSFNASTAQQDEFYEVVAKAYLKIFDRVGLGDKVVRTFASGGVFSKFSDEFQAISGAGEDTIYVDKSKNIAVNREVCNDEVLLELKLNKNDLEENKAIEVGNIFKLGTKFSEAEGLYFTDSDGSKKPVIMGSYGIGVGRLMGTIVEIFNDEQGIIWPEPVAPFKVHLIDIHNLEKSEEIYKNLTSSGLEVLYDDREVAPGKKFAEADLIGIPYRVVVSNKTLESDSVEVKKRDSDKVEMIKVADLINFLNK